MKKIWDTLKISLFNSTSGLVMMGGWAYLGTQTMEMPMKMGLSFAFMTAMGTVTKLVSDKLFVKPDADTKKIDNDK